MEIYFELADVFGDDVDTRPFMRLCVGLEEKFRHIRGGQLRGIKDLCDAATKEENCFFMFEDAWLRTTISLKNLDSFFSGATGVRDILQHQHPHQMLIIRRNIISGTEYLTRLQDFGHRSDWTREFYTHRILEESLREDKSLTEKLKERRKRLRLDRREWREQCELVMSLLRTASNRDAARDGRQDPANPRLIELRSVDIATELVMGKMLAKGSEGDVWEVVWGNCTYAMKKFVKKGPFINEHRIAELREVLHPHIVHSFGRSPRSVTDEDNPEDHDPEDYFLLMELLDGDLSRLLYEDERAKSIQLTGVERLDVLLQIAKAVSKLHENNVVHGDLKLRNILYSELEVSGNVRYFLAKVADFGNALRIYPRSPFEPSGGTLNYASPEVLRWRKNHDVRLDTEVARMVDVYSFGVVACEILTGQWAFSGNLLSIKEIEDIRTGKKKVIDRMAEWKKLKHGFQYFAQVITLVESCLEFDPLKRPTFSRICDSLTICKSNLQCWERRVAACQKIFVIIVMLFIFLHYGSRAGIMTVLLRPTCLINMRSWACWNHN